MPTVARRATAVLAALLLAWSPAPAQDTGGPPGREKPASPAEPGPWTPPARDGPPPSDPNAPLAARVGQAIDAGVRWLRQETSMSGSYGGLDGGGTNYLGGKESYLYPAGPTALVMYTLLKCGVPADDPVVEKGFRWLRRNHEVPGTSYEISTLILAIEALSNPWKREADREREARDRGKAGLLVKLPPEDAAWMRKLVVQLLRRRQKPTGWRYNLANPGDTGTLLSDAPLGGTADLSSTQLALLALAAAERCGLRQPDETYVAALEWTLDRQEKESPPAARPEPPSPPVPAVTERARGWAYLPESRSPREKAITGSMTACGLANVALCSAILRGRGGRAWEKGLAERAERAWGDGAAWFKANWRVDRNPNGSSCYYYLYCIERAAGLRGVRLLAGHDWHTEGARYLVDAQYADGRWWGLGEPMPSDLLGTCFALLFLNRSTGAVATDEEGK